MKRISWFVGGVAAGATGVGYARRKVRSTVAQVSPSGVARSAATKARGTAGHVVGAVREGRDAMRQHEDELKARRDGRLVSLDDHVGPQDQVFVDGVEVDSDRVVVLRPR
ncbi:hypothetical protein [Ilumatobacter sp.]|uniref:hypothetical protein n=1 Tax=Ilumatobacter sp. TaxID=1967498 RepID=UPI003B530152